MHIFLNSIKLKKLDNLYLDKLVKQLYHKFKLKKYLPQQDKISSDRDLVTNKLKFL